MGRGRHAPTMPWATPHTLWLVGAGSSPKCRTTPRNTLERPTGRADLEAKVARVGQRLVAARVAELVAGSAERRTLKPSTMHDGKAECGRRQATRQRGIYVKIGIDGEERKRRWG